MAKVSFVASSATTYDLTDAATNPDAAAEITPRQFGCVARNRINFASVTAPTLTNKVMNVLKVLKIPDRMVVDGLYLIAPRGTAGVTHNVNSKSVESAIFAIGWAAYKSASHTYDASHLTVDADGFGQATLNKATIQTVAGSVTYNALPGDPETSGPLAIRKVATGIAGQHNGWVDGGGDNQEGIYFPYGGFVTMQVESGKGASGVADVSLDGKFSGVLEVAATGWKVPE